MWLRKENVGRGDDKSTSLEMVRRDEWGALGEENVFG